MAYLRGVGCPALGLTTIPQDGTFGFSPGVSSLDLNNVGQVVSPSGTNLTWQDVIAQAINTAGQILKPDGTYQSTIPVYNPAATAAVAAARSPALWLGAAALLFLVLRRR